MKHFRDSVFLLGVRVDPVTVDELHAYLLDCIRNHKKSLVLHVNVLALNLAYKQSWLRAFFNQAELVFADGTGVVLAAKLMGFTLPKRITYADWMWELAAFAETNQIRFFFLGGKSGIAEKAAQKLVARFPQLCVVGVQDGYFDKEPGCPENEQVISRINAAHPDILLTGFGMPLQEKWLMENWERIDAVVALTGGAVFDYISGDLQRAPHWMTDHGLEWLGRLIIEPRRLWKRYLLGNPLFIWRVLLQRFGLFKLDE